MERKANQDMRVDLLMMQGNHAAAAAEVRRRLASSPDDAGLHAKMARIHIELDQPTDAVREATVAVRLGPNNPYAHITLAQARQHADDLPGAEAAARQAIALNPHEAFFRGALAFILIHRTRLKPALAMAEEGLALDPHSDVCQSAQTTAMSFLNRRDVNEPLLRARLAEDPDDSFRHANLGYELLHQGRHKEAATHFREALRLDPHSDYARLGMLEAIKSRHALYGWILGVTRKLALIGAGRQIIFIAALLVISSIVQSTHSDNPWVTLGITVMWRLLAFVCFLVIAARPVSTLMLMLTRNGRLMLSDVEKKLALLQLPLMLMAVAGLAAARWLGTDLAMDYAFVGVYASLLLSFAADTQPDIRKHVLGYTVVVLLLGLIILLPRTLFFTIGYEPVLDLVINLGLSMVILPFVKFSVSQWTMVAFLLLCAFADDLFNHLWRRHLNASVAHG